MYAPIEASETQAAPGDAGERSVTVPVKTTLWPNAIAVPGALTVVLLLPMPKTYMQPLYWSFIVE